MLQAAEFDRAGARQIENGFQVVGPDADNGAADLRIDGDTALKTCFSGNLAQEVDSPDRRRCRLTSPGDLKRDVAQRADC